MKKQKTILLAVVLVGVMMVANTAVASEVTGTLNTGISSPGLVGVVVDQPVVPAAALQTSGGGGGGGGGGGSSSGNNFLTNLPKPEVGGAFSGFNFLKNLFSGMSGEDVKQLQNCLTKGGTYTGPVTGFFGPLTFSAVKSFQAKYGISQVGTVGPLTRAKLNQVCGSSVLGAQTVGSGMTVEQMQALIIQLQAQLAALIAQLKSSH